MKKAFEYFFHRTRLTTAILAPLLVGFVTSAYGFEGRITATLTRGGETQNELYTVGTNFMRIERLETNQPHARDIIDLRSGETTLIFPYSSSFVRITPTGSDDTRPVRPGMGPGPAPFPQGQMRTRVGPQPGAPAGFPNAPGAMPMMPRPMPPMEKMELIQTNGTTNILGFTCSRYELKSSGEVMEIWATPQLFPYRAYLENQPHRFRMRNLNERWGAILAEKKLFPLRAVLRFENGPERLRFEVKSVTPEKINQKDEPKLFSPPSDYHEIQPLPF